jgi:hypothetical protein
VADGDHVTDAKWRRLLPIEDAVTSALGFAASGAFFDGVTVSPSGLVVAVAVYCLPLIVVFPLLRREASWFSTASEGERMSGRLYAAPALAFLSLVWIPVAPLIADWVSPGFNIAGIWPYLGTLAALMAVTWLPDVVRGAVRRVRA